MAMLDFGGRPVVEVMVNGHGPYNFIFDTGAALSVIDSSLAAELALEGSPKIEEFRVGKVSVREVQAFVAPISQMLGSGDVPRGVLSASSFPGSLVRFDYPAKRIRFERGALPPANGMDLFDYDPAELPSLPVEVAGRELTVHLDTGAPYPLALPTKYMNELPLATPAERKGNAKTHGGTMPVFVATLEGDILVGQFKLATRELHFTDVVPFGATEPKGQLGNEALRDFTLTLDSINHRIRLEKSRDDAVSYSGGK